MQVGALFGRYRLDRSLTVDVSGEVWAAFDTVTSRQVVVRVLPPDATEDDEFCERFERDVGIAAQIRNPHIVPIHDFGQIGNRLFLATPIDAGNEPADDPPDHRADGGITGGRRCRATGVGAGSRGRGRVGRAGSVVGECDRAGRRTDPAHRRRAPHDSRGRIGRLRPDLCVVRVPHRRGVPDLGGPDAARRHGRRDRTRDGGRPRAPLSVGGRTRRRRPRRGATATACRRARSRDPSDRPEPSPDRRRTCARRDHRCRYCRWPDHRVGNIIAPRCSAYAVVERGRAGIAVVVTDRHGEPDRCRAGAAGASTSTDANAGRGGSHSGGGHTDTGAAIATGGAGTRTASGSVRSAGAAVLPGLRAHSAPGRSVSPARLATGECTGTRACPCTRAGPCPAGAAVLPGIRAHPAPGWAVLGSRGPVKSHRRLSVAIQVS